MTEIQIRTPVWLAALAAIPAMLFTSVASAASPHKDVAPVPYQATQTTKVEPTSSSSLPVSFEVPAAKMLRLETVTAYCSTGGPTPVSLHMEVTVRANGQRAEFHIPPSLPQLVRQIDASGNEQSTLWSRSVNFFGSLSAFAGPETLINVWFSRSYSGYESYCQVTVAGELFDSQ